MNETAEISREEAFNFPEFASLVNLPQGNAFAMGLKRRVRDSRDVEVAFSEAERVVYEYRTTSEPAEATLLRGAWLRPIGPLDGARPLKIQVLVDDAIVLEEDIDLHIHAGHFPFPRRPCSCNEWGHDQECKCPTTPLQQRISTGVLFGAARVERPTLMDASTFPDDHYGIFAPNGSLVQIKVVKGHSEPVSFKARCGITAALYSTSTKNLETP